MPHLGQWQHLFQERGAGLLCSKILRVGGAYPSFLPFLLRPSSPLLSQKAKPTTSGGQYPAGVIRSGSSGFFARDGRQGMHSSWHG